MFARRCLLLLPLLMLGCSDRDALQNFTSPSYTFLTPIHLNVAALEIDDRSPPPGAGSLEALDPVRPADALKRMALDRLSADGSAGRAVFVIDQASLVRGLGSYDGVLAAHLDVFAGQGGERVGYAEARVVRRQTGMGADENLRTILYNLTLQMMDDMNVEFEYQVRRSLRDWVQTTEGTAPPPPPVTTQPLSSGPSGYPASSPLVDQSAVPANPAISPGQSSLAH